MNCNVNTFEKNIAEMNLRIESAMVDIRKRLDEDPEAPIYDLLKLMINYETSKRTMIWEKEKLLCNACDCFDRRGENALA